MTGRPRSDALIQGTEGVHLAVFLEAITNGLGKRLDDEQLDCITAAPESSLFIVAGPGSGKTTVIALRMLRLVFVDRFEPASIVATTFTSKAAAELRSRILGWGATLRSYLEQRGELPSALASVDINRIVTGTLDALSEETLRSFRPTGQPPPVVLEKFQADALMTHRGLFPNGRFRSNKLRTFYTFLKGSAWGLNFNGLRSFSTTLRDRIVHDQIDLDAMEIAESTAHPGIVRLRELLDDYCGALAEELALDYAGLEQRLLENLESGALHEFTAPVRALFVDEYQDTNFIQERIYFSLVEQTSGTSTLTVVGDDDQALYRFRGATVELFQNYPVRLNSVLGIEPRTVYLSSNYRSSSNIVEFCDSFIKLDRAYESARVSSKPDLRARRDRHTYEPVPILGVFRPSLDEVSNILAGIVDSVFNGAGFPVPGTSLTIVKSPDGTPADCALLCSSPRERDYKGDPRLPLLLDQSLSTLTQPIRTFNPRGTAFHTIEAVQILGGLTLECMDPAARIQDSMNTLPHEVSDRLSEWRQAGLAFATTNPPPHQPHTLAEFLDHWGRRQSTNGGPWPNEAPVPELIYKLVTWLPTLSSDVEGLAYLEAFSRTVVGATRVVEPMVLSNPTYAEGRIQRLIREVFAPLAIGGIDLDEELFETLPGDRLGILSIHQSKGLEFPMVIVDVGCHFRDNRAGKDPRYPNRASAAANLEDFLRQYSDLRPPLRPGIDRTFDDLVRQYFVAFSRAKEVLILAGLSSPGLTGPIRNVKNVAAGWTRDESIGSQWDQIKGVIYV